MDIFIINVSNSDNISQELLREFQKYEISDTQKRRVHSLAYLMLDRILKEVYGIDERKILFINKKPVLKNQKKFFSISHSGEYIALAFSDSDCGIDIEKIISRDFKAISKRMGFSCETLEEFYYAWTMYEAQYKLGKIGTKYKNFQYENCTITALSENPQEEFEIYIQNGNTFSNVNA